VCITCTNRQGYQRGGAGPFFNDRMALVGNEADMLELARERTGDVSRALEERVNENRFVFY